MGSATIGLSGAVSGLSAHFIAGSSQLMHWRSVRPEKVTTGTIRFPHFAQCVIRFMRSSRYFSPIIVARVAERSQVHGNCQFVIFRLGRGIIAQPP
jgi:hypothetical protein